MWQGKRSNRNDTLQTSMTPKTFLQITRFDYPRLGLYLNLSPGVAYVAVQFDYKSEHTNWRSKDHVTDICYYSVCLVLMPDRLERASVLLIAVSFFLQTKYFGKTPKNANVVALNTHLVWTVRRANQISPI